MPKRVLPLALLLALFAAAAQAQFNPGGGGGGGGGGHGGHGRQPSGGSSTTPAPATAPPPKPPKPMNEVEITGVVQALDPAALHVTIAYDAVDELGWPHGSLQFTVYRAGLLQGVTVGERVRFRLDSQQIVALAPY